MPVRLALLGLASTACLAAACTREYHPEYHPQSTYSVSQTLTYPTTILEVGVVPRPGSVEAQPDETPALAHREPTDPSRVLVLTESSRRDRPSEVIGVLDVRVSTDDREAAIEMVKQHAAEMGADAVTSLEFHPRRVSGLALRFPDR